MRGEIDGAEAACEKSDQCEDSDLRGNLQRSWKSHADRAPDVDRIPRARHMLGNFDARDRSGDDRQLQKLTARRGDRCAGNTERRNGAIAKDQNEIEYQVQYVG